MITDFVGVFVCCDYGNSNGFRQTLRCIMWMWFSWRFTVCTFYMHFWLFFVPIFLRIWMPECHCMNRSFKWKVSAGNEFNWSCMHLNCTSCNVQSHRMKLRFFFVVVVVAESVKSNAHVISDDKAHLRWIYGNAHVQFANQLIDNKPSQWWPLYARKQSFVMNIQSFVLWKPHWIYSRMMWLKVFKRERNLACSNKILSLEEFN